MPDPYARSGRPRRRLRAQVRMEESRCHLCGYPVDQTIPQPHRLAWCVDELLPVSMGGSATDRTNCRLAHRICNETRRTKPITLEVKAKCRDKVDHLLAGGTIPTVKRNRRTTTQREQNTSKPSNLRW